MKPKIEFMAGYYEYLLYVNDELIYAWGGDIRDDWYESYEPDIEAENMIYCAIEDIKESDKSLVKVNIIEENKPAIQEIIKNYIKRELLI